jgi:hypothetical protein
MALPLKFTSVVDLRAVQSAGVSKISGIYLSYVFILKMMGAHNDAVCTYIGSESESYVTTDGQPASLSWNKALIRGLRPDFYYCLTVAGVLILSALSVERTGLSFTIAAGPRQRSHFRVRVP